MKLTVTNVLNLIDLATRMRTAQRRATSSKHHDDIRVARDCERRFDGALNEIKHSDVQGLFEELEKGSPK